MAAVTIHSDFGAQENKVCHGFHCFPICLPWRDLMPWSSFFECWVLSQLFHSTLSLSSRLFSSSSLSAIRVVSSAFLRLFCCSLHPRKQDGDSGLPSEGSHTWGTNSLSAVRFHGNTTYFRAPNGMEAGWKVHVFAVGSNLRKACFSWKPCPR